ncbi:MAG: glycosyltransferase [Bacteroidota bacterium]
MYSIIIISPEKWGINHLSKHHYAMELSRRGNRVWFVNPPADKNGIEHVKEKNLTIISYKPVVRGKNRLPAFLSRQLHKIEIGKIIGITGKPNIVWSFDPYRFQWLQDFGASKKIYHAVDLHPGAKREWIIAQNADFVFSTGDSLLRKLRKYNPSAHKIPHGLFVNEDAEKPSITLPGRNAIKSTYLGNLYAVLDFDLIVTMIQQNRDVDFIFIGPDQNSNIGEIGLEAQKLLKRRHEENVFFTGSVPSAHINAYLEKSDILFVCYKQTQINSHKLMSYLYAGKTILTTDIEEYRNNGLIIAVGDKTGFLKKFNEIKQKLRLFNSREHLLQRKAFALQHTYSLLVEKILDMIYPTSDF